jgi:hypothetical protein
MLALLLTVALATPLPTNPPDCVKYFHDACSQALGEWLPDFAYSNDFWDEAKRIAQRDGFSYEKEQPPSPNLLGYMGPADGTFFSYGEAGPPRGHVVYDYQHHIAFYDQGCCSWHDAVAGYASPPPKPVVNRDLTALKTVRGIRLGMSPGEVEAIYGASPLRVVPKSPRVFVLAYTTWPPRNKLPLMYKCGQFQNFYFRHNRLVMIQFGNGC